MAETDWKVLQQIAIEKLRKQYQDEHEKEKLTWWYLETQQSKGE